MDMSDDFGTVNLRRERGREIEVLRQHYRAHRESLVAMIDDAPTEHLALEYQRIIAEIDRALVKLDEIEGAALNAPEPARHPARSAPVPPPTPAPHPAAAAAAAAAAGAAGMRPLAGATARGDETHPPDIPIGREIPGSRLALIAGVAVVALALIGWLIWKASSDRDPAAETIVEERPLTATEADTIAPAAPPIPTELRATPSAHDYGVVRKGTRATRQFEIANNTDEPVTIEVARSTCRCLYYEHAPVIPPRAKETLTVTLDGARAKAGDLKETLRVSAKSSPSVATTVDVIATVQ